MLRGDPLLSGIWSERSERWKSWGWWAGQGLGHESGSGCVCVPMHVCIHACTAFLHVCLHLCTCVQLYMSVYTRRHAPGHRPMCLHFCVRTPTWVCVFLCTCVCPCAAVPRRMCGGSASCCGATEPATPHALEEFQPSQDGPGQPWENGAFCKGWGMLPFMVVPGRRRSRLASRRRYIPACLWSSD